MKIEHQAESWQKIWLDSLQIWVSIHISELFPYLSQLQLILFSWFFKELSFQLSLASTFRILLAQPFKWGAAEPLGRQTQEVRSQSRSNRGVTGSLWSNWRGVQSQPDQMGCNQDKPVATETYKERQSRPNPLQNTKILILKCITLNLCLLNLVYLYLLEFYICILKFHHM